MNEYRYTDISIGLMEQFKVKVTPEMMDSFLSITDDINPLHQDKEYATSLGYTDRVVYGMLTASFLSTLAGTFLPGKYSLIHDVSIGFTKPVFVGDELTVTGVVSNMDETFKLIDIKVSIINQDSIRVVRGTMRVGVLE